MESITDSLKRYEIGRMHRHEVVPMFQRLIDSGLIWTLEEYYKDVALDFLISGQCLDKNSNRREH